MSMPLLLDNPHVEIEKVLSFIKKTFNDQSKSKAVLAVSGGIDSAVALTLLVKALSPQNVIAVLLPYAEQDLTDGQTIMDFNHLPPENQHVIDIQSIVNAAATAMQISPSESVRLGNLKARSRMMCVFDLAKKNDALVCGTENKSEHYLGYFTRFGDAASDIEPLTQWYKTHVRQVASTLGLPAEIQTKAPSAGLWLGQTDEDEMGFSYQVADQVLYQLIDLERKADTIHIEWVATDTIRKVIQQVESQAFKRLVPYTI